MQETQSATPVLLTLKISSATKRALQRHAAALLLAIAVTASEPLPKRLAAAVILAIPLAATTAKRRPRLEEAKPVAVSGGWWREEEEGGCGSVIGVVVCRKVKKSHEIVDIPYPQRVFGFALG